MGSSQYTRSYITHNNSESNSKYQEILNNLEYIFYGNEDIHEKNSENFSKERELLKNGDIVKIAITGRNFSNHKLCQTFFLNEQNDWKQEINEEKNEKDNNVEFKKSSPPFFSNLNKIDFLLSYFSVFQKAPTFRKNFEFKRDQFSDYYENCIELDLPEMSNLIQHICENDIVIYCTDSTNENILKEANFFEYLVKKCSLFKSRVKNNQFFIVLNNHTHDSCLYHYNNKEASKKFKKLNLALGEKFIYEIDIEKSYEEKIIYFSLLFAKYNSEMKKAENGLTNTEIATSENGEKEQMLFNMIQTNNPIRFDPSLNLIFMKQKFNEVLKHKFRVLNSKNFDLSNINKKYELFCKNVSLLENYSNYHLNIVKELDKDLYDSILNIIHQKISNIKSSLLIQNYLYEDIKGSKLENDNNKSIEYPMTINDEIKLVKEKKDYLEKRINESFDYVRKEIERESIYFLKKYSTFQANIEEVNCMINEMRNFLGKKIIWKKMNFLWEIFDIYGLKHYYTSLSVEAVSIYNNYLKEMYLNFSKKLNLISITFESLDKDVINSHNEIIEKHLENKIPISKFDNTELQKHKIESILREKLQANKFFHFLLFKIFSVNNLTYKPFFAFYNVTNLIGVILSLIFTIKILQKMFKFQPKFRKIFMKIVYGFISAGICYLLSCILNKIYNQKSEKRFFKLLNLIKSNIQFINTQLISYDSEIESYKMEYFTQSIKFLNGIENKII